MDTNAFINLGKYSANSFQVGEFDKFSSLFLKQLDKIKNCAIDNHIHVPSQLYRKEINPGTKRSAFRYTKEENRSTGRIQYFERFKRVIGGGRLADRDMSILGNNLFNQLKIDFVAPNLVNNLPNTDLEVSYEDKEIVALAKQFAQTKGIKVFIISDDDGIMKYIDIELIQQLKDNIIILPLIFFKTKPYECCLDKINILHSLQTMKIEDAYFSGHVKGMKIQTKRSKIKLYEKLIRKLTESTIIKERATMSSNS